MNNAWYIHYFPGIDIKHVNGRMWLTLKWVTITCTWREHAFHSKYFRTLDLQGKTKKCHCDNRQFHFQLYSTMITFVRLLLSQLTTRVANALQSRAQTTFHRKMRSGDETKNTTTPIRPHRYIAQQGILSYKGGYRDKEVVHFVGKLV